MSGKKPANLPKNQAIKESKNSTIKRIKEGGLEFVLKSQAEGVFFNKKKIPADVYLQAANAGYSANLIPGGKIYFHINTETIIEDPESPLRGHFCSQIPYNAEEMGYHRGNC